MNILVGLVKETIIYFRENLLLGIMWDQLFDYIFNEKFQFNTTYSNPEPSKHYTSYLHIDLVCV